MGQIRSAPLLITAELPPDILGWADGLRRRHYPPERNRLRAHVTLFHALPPSSEGEIRRLLADLSRGRAPDARISGIMNLGRGTALDVDSPGMVAMHDLMSERLHGLLSAQDSHPLRLHITVQNKVQPAVARALQAELRKTLERRAFRFRGFGLYVWEGGLWGEIAQYPFRG
ncbi:2'-5' RNA ligase family protein [Altererythrobacter sp. CC-YST694]|uniref:2'-5' RNA ligase family protein n=1 Tax=Altererythrobacter sp. CC-YST694 TaxID=2755038 RepID=UPI001D01F0B9|nr:2'-5' RNA ligase family protein [Altererythrobacter sp. CC-YST694]